MNNNKKGYEYKMEENKEIETVSSETTTPAPEAAPAETPVETLAPAPEKEEIEMLEPIEKLDDDPPAVETLDEPEPAPAAEPEVVVEEKKEEAPAPAPEPEATPEPAPAPVVEATPAPEPAPAPVPAPEPAKEEVKEEPKAEVKKEKPKKDKKEIIPIVIIVVGLIVMVILGINMFTKKEEPSGGNSSNNNNNGSEQTNPTPEPTREPTYKKFTEYEMAELFNNTFNAREKDYAEFFKDGETFVLFNSKFSSLFTTTKVDFASLFENDNQKYEAAHSAAGFNAVGTFKVEDLRKSYESLFGGNSFKPADYKIDETIECKIESDNIICNSTVVTGGTANANKVYVKYSSGEQTDDIVTLTVYAIATEDGQIYTSKGVEVTELKGLEPASALSEDNLTALAKTKYKVTYKVDETGTTLQSVEPLA